MASIQPPRKRLRTENDPKAPSSSSSSHLSSQRLYAPFRALGLVTNHVPFAVQTRTTKGSTAPPRIHIVTCLGNSWLMWEGERMTLLFVGTCRLSPESFWKQRVALTDIPQAPVLSTRSLPYFLTGTQYGPLPGQMLPNFCEESRYIHLSSFFSAGPSLSPIVRRPASRIQSNRT